MLRLGFLLVFFAFESNPASFRLAPLQDFGEGLSLISFIFSFLKEIIMLISFPFFLI